MDFLTIVGILFTIHSLGFLLLVLGSHWADNDLGGAGVVGLFFLWEVAIGSMLYDYWKSSRNPSA